jgi:hypothetical protein
LKEPEPVIMWLWGKKLKEPEPTSISGLLEGWFLPFVLTVLKNQWTKIWNRRFYIFFHLLLNTGFHRITLGQSDSAPTGAPSIHWMPELVVDEPEPFPCPACPCWPTVTDKLTDKWIRQGCRWIQKRDKVFCNIFTTCLLQEKQGYPEPRTIVK